MAAESALKTPGKLLQGRKSGQSTSSSSISIPASPFMQKLGYGTGVSVYLMKRSPKGMSFSPWAVKKLNPKCNSSQQSTYQKRLYEEANTLKNLQHPNIVGFRAFAEAKDGTMCLAMEFGGEKSLSDLIEERNKKQKKPFPATTILRVALHMARGLKYLHNDKKLLHGDIKSSNVVIKGDFESIKICDVGCSLPLDENMMAISCLDYCNALYVGRPLKIIQNYSQCRSDGLSDPEAEYIGTEPWKPKEALDEKNVITDKSDIFAYGLTLWEMMTLSVPHLNLIGDEDEDDDDEVSFDEADFDDDAYYAALGTRPPLNVEELGTSYQMVIELFTLCTMEDPRKRPAAAQIVDVLESEGFIH